MSRPSHADQSAAVSAEERERRLVEERAQAALKLQRKQRLQAMAIKRQRNLAYLKKVHNGGCYWLNTVLLTAADIRNLIGAGVPKTRIESFFTLGVSVSKIIDLNAGLPIVRAFSQLMEEWEYVHSGATMQSVKFVMAKNSTCIYPQMSPIEGFSDLSRPSVYKFNNSVVFEHLQPLHIPYELDYAEVFVGLCGQLSRLYEKLVHEDCFTNQVVYDAIVRLDTRVKHHIINQVSKEVTEACARKMKAGTRTLRVMAGKHFPAAAAATTATTASQSPAISKAGSNASLATAGAGAAGQGGQGGQGRSSTSSPHRAAVGIADPAAAASRRTSESNIGAEGTADITTVDNPVMALRNSRQKRRDPVQVQPQAVDEAGEAGPESTDP